MRLSYSTVGYFLTKYEGPIVAKEKLRKFKIISTELALDEEIIEKGLSFTFLDFEDSLQYFSTLKTNSELIITRNEKDFKKSNIPGLSPELFLSSL